MPSKARALALALLASACSGHARLAASPPAPGAVGGYQESGIASWYGAELAGARTASGVRFDPDAMTAAHRSLPLGSYVEVTSVETGRSILVLVNDRGPHRRDRLIDLSRGAAAQLGLTGRAAMPVRLRAVVPPANDVARLQHGDGVLYAAGMPASSASRPIAAAAGARYRIQVASFSSEDRARALASALGAEVVAAGPLWRVRLGPIAAPDVQRTRDALAARGYGDALIQSAD